MMRNPLGRSLYCAMLALHPLPFRRRFSSELLFIFDHQSGSTWFLLWDALISLFRQRFFREHEEPATVVASGYVEILTSQLRFSRIAQSVAISTVLFTALSMLLPVGGNKGAQNWYFPRGPERSRHFFKTSSTTNSSSAESSAATGQATDKSLNADANPTIDPNAGAKSTDAKSTGAKKLAAAQADTEEQHIARIINGLRNAVEIKGESGQKMKLIDRMAYYHATGASIAFIHDGKIEWSRGFGVSKAGGPPVTPDTIFQAASISKPVTAMAVLKLAQEGKIDLDTDINQYVTSWKLPENQFTQQKKVTIREILSHTAGINVHGFGGHDPRSPVPTVLQVLDGQPPAQNPPIRVVALPGTQWQYSGGGYTVLQQALVDHFREPFPQLMQQTILDPVGMKHSTFQQPLPPSILSTAAVTTDENGKPLQAAGFTYVELAAGGLWTTPSDLARFLIEVQNEYAGTSDRVLSESTARQMLTPVPVAQVGTTGNYSEGFFIGGSPSNQYFAHEGTNSGFGSYMIAYKNGDGAVIMVNGGTQLVYEILRSISQEYHWPDFKPAEHTVASVNPSIYDSLVGTYGYINVTREGDRLMGEIPGGVPRAQLYPDSASSYFFRDFQIELTFDHDARGKADAVEFVTPMTHQHLPRTK
jgi:CubicO group peptidase (beta-lactamase class C family)